MGNLFAEWKPRPLTILQHARRILESPERWEPGRPAVNAAGAPVHERPLAMNAAGEPVHEGSAEAVRWSLQGALHRATHWKHPVTQPPTPLPAEAYAAHHEVFAVVRAAIGIGAGDLAAVDLKAWGDAVERTHAEALEVIDRAIAVVERKAG
jgi:hypothetical protein